MKNNTPVEKAATTSNSQAHLPEVHASDSGTQIPQNITGRAIFAVDTAAAGIVVRTGFLTEQGNAIDMPAVFPNLSYALDQIDHLRQIVIERFAQAAQVGVQVIAAQGQRRAAAATSADADANAEPYEATDASASASASI